MGHVTLTTPLLGWFVIHQLGYDIVVHSFVIAGRGLAYSRRQR